MNERIKELLEQAGPLQEVLSEITEQTNDKGPRYIRSMTLLDFQLKKFAELIVRECYESCKSQVLDKETADTNELTYNDAVGDCAIGLLQHFGMME